MRNVIAAATTLLTSILASPLSAQTVPATNSAGHSLFYPPQDQSLSAGAAQGSTVPVVSPPNFCPMGRTANGICVNPYVARAGINTAIAFGQANISASEHPYPATRDTTYAYPTNVGAAPPLVTRQTLYTGAFNAPNPGAFVLQPRVEALPVLVFVPGQGFGNGGTIARTQRGE